MEAVLHEQTLRDAGCPLFPRIQRIIVIVVLGIGVTDHHRGKEEVDGALLHNLKFDG